MVAVNISANPSGAVNSIEQIRQAIRRTGQEAKEFSQLNLGHPELAGMADEITRMQRAFDGLSNMTNSTTARAVRQSGARNFWDIGPSLDRSIPEQGRRTSVYNNVVDNISNPENGRPQQRGPMFQAPSLPDKASVWQNFKQGSAFALGLAGIPMLGGLISKAVQGAQEDLMATDVLKRSISDTDTGFWELNKAVHEAAKGLGITTGEANHLVDTWKKLGSETNSKSIIDSMALSTGVARTYGADPGVMANSMARSSMAGLSAKDFAGIMKTTMQDSTMVGKADDVAQAIAHWTEMSSRSMVKGNSTAEMVALYSALNQKGDNNPGLHGAAGLSLLETIQQTLGHGGGGGEAGQMVVYQALAKAGIENPVKQSFLLENGPFSQLPGGGNAYDAVRKFQQGQSGLSDAYLARQRGLKDGDKDSAYLEFLTARSTVNGPNMHQMEGLDSKIAGVHAKAGLTDKQKDEEVAKLLKEYKESTSPGKSVLDAHVKFEEAVTNLGALFLPLTETLQNLTSFGINKIVSAFDYIEPLTTLLKNLADHGIKDLVDQLSTFNSIFSFLLPATKNGEPNAVQQQSYRNSHPDNGEIIKIAKPDVSKGIKSALAKSAIEAGLDPAMVLTIISGESNFNPDARPKGGSPKNGYHGLGQLGTSEWLHQGGGDRSSVPLQVQYAVQDMAEVKRKLSSRLGRDATPYEVWLGKIQGVAGAAALIRGGSTKAVDVLAGFNDDAPAEARLTGNHGSLSDTSDEYTAKIKAVYEKNSKEFDKLPADDHVNAPAKPASGTVSGQITVRVEDKTGKHISTQVVPVVPGEPKPSGGGNVGMNSGSFNQTSKP